MRSPVTGDRSTHRTRELPILGSVTTDPSTALSRPTALITGGGTGIGAAIARRLSRDGFDVVVAGRRREKLDEVVADIEGAGGSARALVMDVTDPASVTEGVASLGRCDVVVNNAGGALGVTRVEDGDPEEWERMFATNVVGTLRVTQAVLPLLRRSSRATIVDISSIAGERVYEGGAGYVAAKHGTSVVSETLRLELNGENIRVVDIRPGMVHTEEFSLTRLHGDRAAADKVYDGVDRPLVADDVAECVGFVVGPAAARQHRHDGHQAGGPGRPAQDPPRPDRLEGRLMTPTSRASASASTSTRTPRRGRTASCGSPGCTGRGSAVSTATPTPTSRPTRRATRSSRRPGSVTSARTSARRAPSSPARPASRCSPRPRGSCARPATRSATSRSRSSATGPKVGTRRAEAEAALSAAAGAPGVGERHDDRRARPDRPGRGRRRRRDGPRRRSLSPARAETPRHVGTDRRARRSSADRVRPPAARRLT